MPIPYTQRRQKRQQLAEELPPDLRDHIALRHVETVSKFSSDMHHRLAEAIAANVRIPAAIQFLKDNPNANTDQIIVNCQKTTSNNGHNAKEEHPSSPEPKELAFLADLLQSCYPDMPKASAAAMVRSELLSEVLGIIRAQRTCFESSHSQSEFVVVVLCGLVLRTIEQLKQIISQRTVYQQALQQSGVEWPY